MKKTQAHYKVDIRWSDEDRVFVARVPELDGVVTHGKSIAQAAKMAEEAIELHLLSLKAQGETVPTPASLRKLNGKYPLRMGRDRHQDVVVNAAKLGLSVNEYLNLLIDNAENIYPMQKKRTKNRAG